MSPPATAVRPTAPRPPDRDDAGDGRIVDEVLESVAGERPLRETLDLIARRVSEEAGFDFCAVLLVDAGRRRIQLAGAHNFPARYAELLNGIFRVPYADATLLASPTSRALREGRTVVLEDALGDPSYEPWRALAEGYGFGSLVSVPLLTQGEAVGVVNGYSRARRMVAAADVRAMERLALQASLALRLTLLVEARHDTILELRRSNELLTSQRTVLERAHDIHLRLTDAVISGAGFEAVATVLAGLLGRPVAVVDDHRQLVCTSALPPGDPFLDELERRRASLEEPAAGSVRRGGHAGGDGEGALMSADIRVGEEVVGAVLVADSEAASRDLDRRAIEHGATVLAVHVAKERVARATEERLQADFLHDLLSGRDDDAWLADRAAHYGLALAESHRVLVAVADERPRGSGEPAVSEEERTRRRDRVLRLCADVLRERLPGAFVGRLGDAVTAVIPSGDGADGLTRCRAVAGDCRRRAGRQAPVVDVSIGIGGAQDGPAGCRGSHEEAQRCVHALRRLDRRGAVMAGEDLGVLGLFLDTNRPEQLVALGQAILGPVADHDARSHGALVQTLETYLDQGCDLRASADELFVHHNTVKYRLRKVEELSGLDLRRPDDLLRATLARLSLRLLGTSTRPALS